MIEIGGYCLDMDLILESITTFIAALLVYWLGLKAYYRQKEYENVRSRYLENGVEVVISQIDYILGVLRNNWTLLLRTTRQYRELESQVSVKDFLNQFREVDQDKFQLAPVYKTKPLLNDDVLWRAYQSAFSFVGTTNDQIKSDFVGVLNEVLEHPDSADKEGFLREAEEFAIKINTEAKQFYLIIGHLHQMAETLEKGKFTFKDIYELHKKTEFSEIVNSLNQMFPNEEEPNK